MLEDVVSRAVQPRDIVIHSYGDGRILSKTNLDLDPDVAYQVTVQTSLPKRAAIDGAIWRLVRPNNLVSKDGPEHKRWRAIFSSGFSNPHLMTLLDGVVDGVVDD